MATLKKKLKQHVLTVGSWITLGDSYMAEIMAKAGFDWIVIDMEHSAITIERAAHLIQLINLCGVPVLVRVGENNPNIIKRVMDAGADGVIVPNVNSPGEARRAVESVKYPPLGKRGVGLFRAQGYGRAFDRYRTWLPWESIVIIQIEHIQAVQHIDAIFAVDGVDAFIIGPYDLSGSMGLTGQLTHPKVEAVVKKVLRAAEDNKIVAGYHSVPCDFQEAAKRIKQGFRFLGFSLDTIFFQDKVTESLAYLRKSIKQ